MAGLGEGKHPSKAMPVSKPNTVSSALASATAYWLAHEPVRARGCNMMVLRAGRCADLLGLSRKLSTLGPEDGAALLMGLRKGGLSRSSVSSYYAAGKRMLALSGLVTAAWPKAPSPARKVRDAVDPAQIDQLLASLRLAGWEDTASLVELMRDTGLRVEREALRGDWGAAEGRLVVHSGKGGHARVIPYEGSQSGPLGGLTYEGHLRRIKATGSPLRPHDLRRAFIARVYEASGKDLRMAQVLAGHANPATTAGYIGADFERMRDATLHRE